MPQCRIAYSVGVLSLATLSVYLGSLFIDKSLLQGAREKGILLLAILAFYKLIINYRLLRYALRGTWEHVRLRDLSGKR